MQNILKGMVTVYIRYSPNEVFLSINIAFHIVLDILLSLLGLGGLHA